ncbi:glycosyltransferase [Metasolibacillus meyeri]|uniref:glycosyltransferase n=1 Tax=Metasolibacillus meyeri TaxID=1071052 RepID=UPI000D2F9C92|nr:glycosyltransferase [Metasolibacillus meyeri]
MKKAFIISNMYPTKEHLAYGVFVKNQVQQLNAAGIETVIAVNDNPATGKKNVIKKYTKWALNVLLTFRKNKREISLTHAHYVFPSGLFSYYLKKRYKVPYVVTAHGGDINKMAKKSARIKGYTTKILQHADHVIAVGEELAQTIQQDYGIEPARISIMSMGINRNVFTPADKQQMQKELGMDSERTNFLFVGNIIEEKGVYELITAFQQLEKAHAGRATLYCIGSTKDAGFTEKVKALVKSEHIHFIEPMPQAELARYFQAADVFVLPSYIEGLGLVALEAMSCGTPVIASSVGGLKYMLAEDAGVLVPPMDAVALQQAMERALTGLAINEAKVQELLTTHDAQNIVVRLKAIYANVE